MNVESSFLKDRPASPDEIRNLETGTPKIFCPREYDDIFRVPAIDPGADVEKMEIETPMGKKEASKAKTQDWYFRMN